MSPNDPTNPSNRYTYQNAGFNRFLNRSLKSNPTANSVSDGIAIGSGTAVNLDRQQIGGNLGNILVVGKLTLDGIKGRILVHNDGDQEVGWIGNLVP